MDHKKNGAKWISKIDGNKEIDKLFQACYSCPQCNWDGRKYYEELKIAIEQDLPIPTIKTRVNKSPSILRAYEPKQTGVGTRITDKMLGRE